MRLTGKLLRTAWRANRIERAVSNPGRYVKQRAKSKVLGKTGFWRAWSRWWRA
jgi:hypothetical protein